MDQCTHEVRRQHWKNIIAQCNQRPEGQTAKQWLDAHGICEQTYYRWQRLIRREIFDQTSSALGMLPSAENTEVAFAEIPIPAQTPVIQLPDSFPTERQTAPAAVIRTAACTIELSNTVSSALVAAILQEVTHA